MNRRVTVELHIGSLLLGLAGGAVVMWVVEIFKSIFGGKGVINAGTGQAGTASENATVINAQGNASVTTIGTQNVQSVIRADYEELVRAARESHPRCEPWDTGTSRAGQACLTHDSRWPEGALDCGADPVNTALARIEESQ